jgi:hypothetical protein
MSFVTKYIKIKLFFRLKASAILLLSPGEWKLGRFKFQCKLKAISIMRKPVYSTEVGFVSPNTDDL